MDNNTLPLRAHLASLLVAVATAPAAMGQVDTTPPEAGAARPGEASAAPQDDMDPMTTPGGLMNGIEVPKPAGYVDPKQGTRAVHPITAPNYSDDPFITTDIRGTYINHQFPNNANLNGGAARIYDVQARVALDSRLQLMISKAGVADVHLPGSEEYGASDVALGLKYALANNPETKTNFALGAGYEFGVGDEDTFGDDDEVRVFATFAQGFDRMHVSGIMNYLIATGDEDPGGDSDRFSVHVHADYELNEMLSPVVELNYYTVVDEGSPVSAFSGIDLANLGGNADEDVLSVGLGGELRPIQDFKVRLAYESPLTSNDDLFGYRWTLSAIWSF